MIRRLAELHSRPEIEDVEHAATSPELAEGRSEA